MRRTKVLVNGKVGREEAKEDPRGEVKSRQLKVESRIFGEESPHSAPPHEDYLSALSRRHPRTPRRNPQVSSPEALIAIALSRSRVPRELIIGNNMGANALVKRST